MARHTYFAELAPDGTVLRVIVSEQSYVAKLGGTWVQTFMPDDPGPPRRNYAGPGHKWDAGRDAFIAPKPSDDATFDEVTATWKVPPRAMPSEGKPSP